MSYTQPILEAGLITFGDLLEAEYGLGLAHWADLPAWSGKEKSQISRALEVLILEPIADPAPNSDAAIGASEIGARRTWTLSDQKISGADFETTWQWSLLAALDNATKNAMGEMMTPSDPRLFILKFKYQSEFFVALAQHFATFLCGRALVAAFDAAPSPPRAALMTEACVGQAAALLQVPGFEAASPVFIAGVLFMISRLGAKSFCDWSLDCC